MSEHKELIKYIALCTLLFGLFMLPVLGFDYWYSSSKCTSYGDITEREVKYSWRHGCFVRSETGKYIHKDELRQLQ